MEDIIQKYGVFFSIKILHPDFKEGACPYVDIEPDPGTKKVFRNMHLIDKKYPGEIKIVTQINEIKENNKTLQKPAYNIDKNQYLMFLIKLTDYNFFKLSSIDMTGFPRQVLYFSNSSNSMKIQVQKCKLAERLLNIPFTTDKTPLSISIMTGNKKEIFHEKMKKTDTVFMHDLSAYQNGLYLLVAEYAQKEKNETQIFYYDPSLRKEPILGIININPIVIGSVNDNKNIFNVPYVS